MIYKRWQAENRLRFELLSEHRIRSLSSGRQPVRSLQPSYTSRYRSYGQGTGFGDDPTPSPMVRRLLPPHHLLTGYVMSERVNFY